MSQAATWNVPTAGPGTMSQFAARASDSFNALYTMHSGASRPSYAVAGTLWLQIVDSDEWVVNLYTGTVDIAVGTFDPVGETFTLNADGLGFATSAIARKDVSPLSLIDDRARFVKGSNNEGILRLLGRNGGNGDEASIQFYNGVTDAVALQIIANQATSLRMLDASSVEFLEFLATGDIESKLWDKLSEQIVPRGALITGPWTSAPPGFVAANGAEVSRTTYARLWAAAQARGKVVSEATWAAGAYGAFSTGDTSTTFRLPSLNGDFIRAVYGEATFTIGTWQDSDNKTHNHGGATATEQGHAHNYDYPNTTVSIGYDPGGASATYLAQGVSATNSTSAPTSAHAHNISAQGASEARPKNIPMLACIKI